nr:ankyrin repeat domain-containing protein [Myxococcus sp. MH1]
MSPKKKLSPLDARLLAAIEASNAKDVAKQLAAGANPNTVDAKGYPALHSAASEGSLELVRLLLDAGADVHAQDSDGAIALSFATAQSGDEGVALVRLLIDKGSNVNQRWNDEAGSTVLTDLFGEDNEAPSEDILAVLLKAGVDVNAPNGQEETPLMLAATFKDQPKLTELLLEHGASVETVNDRGWTALMWAIRAGNEGAVERLIAKGANVNHLATDDEGDTALTLTVNEDELFSTPSPRIVSALLRAGANPNQPNARGWTPLHLAACIEDVAPLEALLAARADPHLANTVGYYPIDLATRRGHTKVIERLLAAGSPTREQAARKRMDGIWKQIGDWADKHHPDHASRLTVNRPATPERIAALEKQVGKALPSDFRAFLQKFGGGTPTSRGLSISEYDVLTTEQIQELWKGLREHVDNGVFKKARPHELSKDQRFVKWTWWHPGWVPFASDSGGNLYCVDLEPEEHGSVGQVIRWEIHGGPLGPFADSMEDFFEEYLRKLESGRYDASELE